MNNKVTGFLIRGVSMLFLLIVTFKAVGNNLSKTLDNSEVHWKKIVVERGNYLLDDANIKTDRARKMEEALADIQLKIGSFNLRYITTQDVGERSWRVRKDIVRRRIIDHDFDILGTQEGVMKAIRDIAKDMPYDYVAAGRDDGQDEGETSAILYKRDKFNLKNSGTFWLSTTPNTASKGWDAALNRICTWIELEDKASRKTIFYFNTHFDHKGEDARLKSSKLILDKIQEIAGESPVILTGDLNGVPQALPILALSESNRLWDARALSETSPVGPENTFFSFNLSKDPMARIDYIFVTKDFDVLRYETIDDDYKENKVASDHLPILAVVKL